MGLYFEVKELWYRSSLLATYPELAPNGTVCPNRPFWWEYQSAKIESLFDSVPELSRLLDPDRLDALVGDLKSRIGG